MPELLADESLDSWVEHLADLNHCPPRALTRFKDSNNANHSAALTRNASDEVLQTLSHATGMPHLQLERATLRRYAGAGLSHTPGRHAGEGTWSQTAGTKYCPHCLQENDLRWLLPWHLRWHGICDRHRVLLAERCPTCGQIPRTSRTHHPRRRAVPMSVWRLKHCPSGCATEILATATTLPIDTDSLTYRCHEWLTTLIADGSASPDYADGAVLSAETVLTDATVLTRQALNAMTFTDGIGSIAGVAPGQWIESLTADDFVPTSMGRGGAAKVSTEQFLIAQTAAISVLMTPRAHQDKQPAWFDQPRIRHAVNYLRRSTGPAASVHFERLLGWQREQQRTPVTGLSDALGRRRTAHAFRSLRCAVSNPLDPLYLPACIWRTVRDHAPEMPDRVERLFPITAPIALAALGRAPDFMALAEQFRITWTDREIRVALDHLVVNEAGGALDYLVELHHHLAEFPPPIDYRRRRYLFPAPSDIGRNHTRQLARAAEAYLTDAFTWKIQRYVWQLLTGADPLITTGGALLHGPAAYAYRKFVLTMPDDVQDKAGQIAQRLLLHHRIGEPVGYRPVYDIATQAWLPGGRAENYLPDIGRRDLRRSSHSLTAAASAAGNTEELVHLALAGERATARRLVRFVDTAYASNAAAAANVAGVLRTQINREMGLLSKALGDDLFDRESPSHPRTLTRDGRQLLHEASRNIDALRAVAAGTEP
ncbi:TniQ family protein [Nocardia salmonicida]|uniref:TniQ family protein n=1 Tax=Nocardia salmonicida TaxID=53431 RepID=UPI0013F4E492|nr:TniQ family protein [Nocardia salmonicida]